MGQTPVRHTALLNEIRRQRYEDLGAVLVVSSAQGARGFADLCHPISESIAALLVALFVPLECLPCPLRQCVLSKSLALSLLEPRWDTPNLPQKRRKIERPLEKVHSESDDEDALSALGYPIGGVDDPLVDPVATADQAPANYPERPPAIVCSQIAHVLQQEHGRRECVATGIADSSPTFFHQLRFIRVGLGGLTLQFVLGQPPRSTNQTDDLEEQVAGHRVLEAVSTANGFFISLEVAAAV